MTDTPTLKIRASTDLKKIVSLPHPYKTIPGTNIPVVTSATVPVSDMKVETDVTPNGVQFIDTLDIGIGASIKATPRFVNSMCGLIGQSKSVFSLFSPDEVLQRVLTSGRTKHERYNVQFVERVSGELETVAVTSADKKSITSEEIVAAMSDHVDLMNISYHDGSITTLHDPIQANDFLIGNDEMKSRFVLSTPIDGYGSPTSYLAIIRSVCTNLMIGYDTVFKSVLKAGEGDRKVALSRFMSTLSVAEILTIRKSMEDETFSAEHREAFRDMIRGGEGERSLNETYGVANFAEHPVKRLRCLPSKCSVYDLVNFATEFGTHYATDEASRRSVNTSIASVIAAKGGLDLEGVCTIKSPTDKPLWLNN